MAIKAYHDSRGESNRKVANIIRSDITLACLLGKNEMSNCGCCMCVLYNYAITLLLFKTNTNFFSEMNWRIVRAVNM